VSEKLSDRVRPDVEAARWVVDEIKVLERELAEARKQRDRLMNALEAVVEVARRNLSRPHPTVERFNAEALAAVKGGSHE
jgi:hypothetical protein